MSEDPSTQYSSSDMPRIILASAKLVIGMRMLYSNLYAF